METSNFENPYVGQQSAPQHKTSKGGKNFYEILDVRPDANRADIRSAYIRIKSSLSPVGGATYSLLDTEDLNAALRDLEEAYRTLDDEYLRRRYDSELSNVPMDETPRLGAESRLGRLSRKVAQRAGSSEIKERIASLLQNCDHPEGALIRALRTEVGVESDEIQANLKISSYYLKALEEDDFAKLPPLVYVRGFLKSLLEYLGVSEAKQIIEGYSRNLTQWKKSSEKKKL